ncbi:MAG: M23 family metallopeptidase [Methanomicrobiales archaeon]|nr:M23 family metallopeptidase [Methanomicrobiales archaeon]
MSTWPVPADARRRIPEPGEPGSFWEDRGDRFHCGIDIYAPAGSGVVAIEDGRVLRTGVQTDPGSVPYWNRTWYVLIEHAGGRIARYAELAGCSVAQGDAVREGEQIGSIGTVIEPARVTAAAPAYIRRLAEGSRTAMLHLEVYARNPEMPAGSYAGGNWFGPGRPAWLLDPAVLLAVAEAREHGTDRKE